MGTPGILRLPEGYTLDESDPDLAALVGPNGKVVARFTEHAHPAEIEAEARVHEARVYEAWGRYTEARGTRIGPRSGVTPPGRRA